LPGSRIYRFARIPGMTVIFCEIGQDVHVTGGDLTAAINQGVRSGYKKGYLRKSVVRDPLHRINTGDNTPAVIHYESNSW